MVDQRGNVLSCEDCQPVSVLPSTQKVFQLNEEGTIDCLTDADCPEDTTNLEERSFLKYKCGQDSKVCFETRPRFCSSPLAADDPECVKCTLEGCIYREAFLATPLKWISGQIGQQAFRYQDKLN